MEARRGKGWKSPSLYEQSLDSSNSGLKGIMTINRLRKERINRILGSKIVRAGPITLSEGTAVASPSLFHHHAGSENAESAKRTKLTP
jgi:hypothetical protein